MKNKIYSKLFQFCEPKSWVKRENTIEPTNYSSAFYPEYKLEFKCEGLVWRYYIYKKQYYNNSYEDRYCHKGFVTFNKTGKLLFLLIFFGFFVLFNSVVGNTIFLQPKIISLIILFLFLTIAHFLSKLVLSIFNWKIYLALRKAQNCEKLKIKDDHEKLEKEIVQIVNQAVAKNPKLARKKKLLQLEKKWFWQK